MKSKIFCLVSVFVLLAMLVLNFGYVQAQTPGQIPMFGQPLTGMCNSAGGNDCIDSVITQDPSGNIGIGTTTPQDTLDVSGGIISRGDWDRIAADRGALYITAEKPSIRFSDAGGYIDAVPNDWLLHHSFGDLRFFENTGTQANPIWAERVTFSRGGNVGIGTTAPEIKLDVAGSGRFTNGVSGQTTVSLGAGVRGDNTSAPGGLGDHAGVIGFSINGPGVSGSSTSGPGVSGRSNSFFSPGVRARSADDSATRLGLEVLGTATITGKVSANSFNGQCLNNSSPAFFNNGGRICNADLAEAYASAEPTKAGDVVALVPGSTATVRKSARPYEELLAGVVSTNPGLVFDNGQTHLAGDNSKLITEDKTVVALAGRVSVKVSLENGPIRVGDPLTSSSKPGSAMKATQAGKVLGYALEAADKDGTILLFVQPGYYISPKQLAQLSEMDELKAQVSKLEGLLKTVLAQRPEESASDYVLTSGR